MKKFDLRMTLFSTIFPDGEELGEKTRDIEFKVRRGIRNDLSNFCWMVSGNITNAI